MPASLAESSIYPLRQELVNFHLVPYFAGSASHHPDCVNLSLLSLEPRDAILMATTNEPQQNQGTADVHYGPASQFYPEASNLRSYVNRVVDQLKRSDPDGLLRFRIEDSIRDLAQFGNRELRSRKDTPSGTRLPAQDLLISLVIIPDRSTNPVDQLDLDHVDFNTFLAHLRRKLFTSGDSMMSIW
jgi:hypothetical protein